MFLMINNEKIKSEERRQYLWADQAAGALKYFWNLEEWNKRPHSSTWIYEQVLVISWVVIVIFNSVISLIFTSERKRSCWKKLLNKINALYVGVTHLKKCTESPRQWYSWSPYKFRVFHHHTCSPKWPYRKYCSSRRSCRKNTPSMQNHTVHTSKEKKNLNATANEFCV